jgi:methyl-accepting chemotaxis protein
MVRRVLGFIIIATVLVGLYYSLYGLFWVQKAADQVERDLVSSMDLGIESLEVISQTLVVTIQTVNDTALMLNDGVESSSLTANTLNAIGPAMTDLGDIVANQLPSTLDAVQQAMPSLEQAAGAIDSTLTTLSRFQWSAVIPIINYELVFGLGIDYAPEKPLDAAVREVSTALEGLPEQLSGIHLSLEKTRRNLEQTETSVTQFGQSLNTASEDLETTSQVLQQYTDLVSEATRQVRRARWDVRDRVQGIRAFVSGLLVWIALSQAAPLYLGLGLLFARRPGPPVRPSSAPAGSGSHGEQERPSTAG